MLEVYTAHHFTFTASSKPNPAMARAYSIIQNNLPEESYVLPYGSDASPFNYILTLHLALKKNNGLFSIQ